MEAINLGPSAGASLNLPVPAAKSPITAAEAEVALQNAAHQAAEISRRHQTQHAAVPVRKELGRLRIASTAELDAQEAAAERCRLAGVADECRRTSGVPARYATARASDVSRIKPDHVEKYTATMRSLLKLLETPGTVALIGTIGAGKTHMACALIHAFCDKGRSARYATAMDYIIAVRRAYDGKKPQEQIEAEYIRHSLLVLDEMQVRMETANEEMLLLRLLDKRYQNNRATLLLSNHPTKHEFLQRVDARIADRMREGGGILVADWESLRGNLI